MKQIEQPNYCSYVLRMWREDESGTWRATLRDARDGKQHNFAALAPLVAFLERHSGAVVEKVEKLEATAPLPTATPSSDWQS